MVCKAVAWSFIEEEKTQVVSESFYFVCLGVFGACDGNCRGGVSICHSLGLETNFALEKVEHF